LNSLPQSVNKAVAGSKENWEYPVCRIEKEGQGEKK
jgi:hypothetical protein